MSHELDSSTPERKISVIGHSIEPLKERLLDRKLDGLVVSYEADDQFKFTHTPVKEMTEKDVIIDYYDFLSQVRAATGSATDVEAVNMLAMAETFGENTVFLTHEDFQEATMGLAHYHEDFLKRNEEARVIFFHRKARAENSQSYVTRSIVEEIDLSVASRVEIVTEETLKDVIPEVRELSDVRIVVADDWMVTGNNVANDLGNLLRQLDEQREKIQVNLINVRSDQRNEPISALDRLEETYGVGAKIPIVGYFESPVVTKFHENPTPTGSWSSVDYGFSSQLSQMRDYLARKGNDRSMPYISTIKGSYK